jgi:CHAT domain-containing protein
MRGWLSVCLLLMLSCCDKPPPGSYYKAQTNAQGTPIGNNTTGEPCTMVRREGGGADLFCGAWQQPSARIRSGGAATSDLVGLATSSPWRIELESRFACGEPKSESATIVILQCRRRSGGWPQVALVTVAGNTVWLADGTPASYPVIQSAVGQLAGKGTATSAPPISADMASYLAARAYSAGDISQYEGLMSAGLQANLAGNPADAEKAYRAALSLQEKQQGADNPAGAAAMMSVALQLSDQGRFDDAKNFFLRAEKAVRSTGGTELDANGQARLALYLGLDALNQNDPKAAIKRFTEAETAFREQEPDAPDVPSGTGGTHFVSGGLSLAASINAGQPYATLAEKEALLGILEARRDRAIAERLSGDTEKAVAVSRSAQLFAKANGLTAALYTARLYRTAGLSAAADHQGPEALAELNESVRAFLIAQPQTRPTAETEMVHAAALAAQGHPADALVECRAAVSLLQETKDSVDFERMRPCLDVFEAQAAATGTDSQQLLREMFAASQLTRGSITDQEIRRTAVRLAAGGADPRVSEAIRRQQDAEHALGDLLRNRDDSAVASTDAATVAKVADLTKAIADARAKLADADEVVQSAAPNYEQLIQQPVKPEDVFAALGPNEAFVAITLSDTEGWTFVLRDKRLAVAHIGRGRAQVADMVKRLRASIEPGEDDRVPEFNVAVAQQLYDVTLGGVASALAGATAITVAPTGPLLSIPFEVLLTGPANSRNLSDAPFLMRKFVITHVPAAANFVRLRQTAPSTAPNPWFGFGNFRPITQAQALRTYPGDRCRNSALELAGLPRLDGTQSELGLASRVFGAPAQDEVTGPAFTVQAVKATRLADFRIIHFATHALLPAEIACQEEPAIVTSAPDGAEDAHGALLTTGDIAGLKLNADTVILSACNSGGPGGTSAGESLAGLARSFFYAGARSLLVTHWSVEDQFATYLVAKTLDTFKQHPADGLAAALRQAQLTFLGRADIDANLKHPYYWAPFALVGEGSGHAMAVEKPASARRGTGL